MSNTSFNSEHNITTSKMDPLFHAENSTLEPLSPKASGRLGGDTEECESCLSASVEFELIR